MHQPQPLVEQLLADPAAFYASGRGNDLLQEINSGLTSTSVLTDLLKAENEFVLRTAIWIVSELNEISECLVHNAIKLLRNDSFYVRSYCLEIILKNSVGDRSWMFKFILEHLADTDERVRGTALRMALLANRERLLASQQFFSQHIGEVEHQEGISLLLSCLSSGDRVKSVIAVPNHMLITYAAIGARLNARDAQQALDTLRTSKDINLAKLGSRS